MPGPLGIGGGGGGSGGTVTTPVFPFIDRAVAQTIGDTGVQSLTAGAGISTSASTGAVTITNSGVTSIVAGSGLSVSGATGAVTVTASGGLISRQTVTSQLATVTFTSIPQTYGALRVVGTYYANGSSSYLTSVAWNGLASGYGYVRQEWARSNGIYYAESFAGYSTSSMSVTVTPYWGSINGLTGGWFDLLFPAYAETARGKRVHVQYFVINNGASSPMAVTSNVVGTHATTTAITSLTLVGQFPVGTEVALYGVQ